MAGCADDIAAWLDKLGLNEYTEKFLSAGYSSLKECVTLSQVDLLAIGITNVDHVSTLFRDLERMKADGVLEGSPSPASLSPSGVTDSTSSGQHKGIPLQLWSNPLRRITSFLTHNKSNASPAVPLQKQKTLPRKMKFDCNDSPSLFQRTMSLRKTFTERKFFRRHSMHFTRNETTSGSKLKDDSGKLVVPPANANGHLLSGNTLDNAYKDANGKASPPPLPSKVAPQPPKDPISQSATVSMPPMPAQKASSPLKRFEVTKTCLPNGLPPKLPPKKAAKGITMADTSGKSNIYETSMPKPLRCAVNLPSVKGKEVPCNSLSDQRPAVPPRSIPSRKAVGTLAFPSKCNNKDYNRSLPVIPKKQPSPSSSLSDVSDTELNDDQKFVRGTAIVTDKYVSIRSDNKSGSINIFVSKPECIVESSESSEEEDECNSDTIAALSPNTSCVSPNAKVSGKELLFLPTDLSVETNGDKRGINNMSTNVQKSARRLTAPQIKIQHLNVISPPSSAPPSITTATPLPALSLVKCASSKEMSIDSETSTYNQLQIPEEMKQQIKEKNNEAFASLKKDQMIVTKCFQVKYLFLLEKIRSKVQKITQGSEIQSFKLITDPHCALEIVGTKTAVEQAEPDIFGCIASLENKITSSTLQFVNPFARPALNSIELLQLCKELYSELAISLKIQLQPKPILSAAVGINKSDVMVQLCEGDIALDSCTTFINFTDGNLTMSDEVTGMLSQAEINRYKHHIKCNGPQPPGKAFYFCSKCRSNTGTVMIHAILPEWVDGNSGEDGLIISAVLESLNLAAKYEATSVCLPFISWVDSRLPLDVLAKSCLSALHSFTMHSTHVKMVRLVLPINMAEIFLNNFKSGVFNHFIITEDLDIIDPDNIKEFCNLGNSAWLWEDDDGRYNFFQPEDNKILNQESAICFNFSCSLNIGPSVCKVCFKSMTQTNMRTLNTRKVARIPLGCVWQFENYRGKWESFPPQVTLMIEAMFLTGTDHYLTINGCLYSYDFNRMMQVNVNNKQSTQIRRIEGGAVFDDAHSTAKSKITMLGSAKNINITEERLLQCLKSLIVIHNVDVQKKFIPAVEKCIKQTQRTNTVKIVKISETDVIVKYSIMGFKDCVQKAAFDMYKVTAMASFIQKPVEWEPQSKSVELKEILKGSPEWSRICACMRTTLKCNVVSIERIQNEFLWEKYVQHKELMGYKGLQSTFELELFHGTRVNPPNYIYESEEGFDMRYSREGLWGLGNYFAESANYASCFAYKTTDNILQLFLVKVLVGDSCEIPSDSTLRMPPFKANGKVRYDTVNGVTKGSRVCITYSNDKAYPFYLISYTI